MDEKPGVFRSWTEVFVALFMGLAFWTLVFWGMCS